jgi:putative acyl-CoA dehydrogenase
MPIGSATHDVVNQPPPLEGYDVYGVDAALREAVVHEGGVGQQDDLHTLGRLAGSAEAIGWGVEANRHGPELRTFDRFGNRIDEVAFHPAYHRLLEVAVTSGLAAAPWASGSHVARAAGFVVWSQVDAGVGCPASMTYASVPVLRERAELAEAWVPPEPGAAATLGTLPAGVDAGAIIARHAPDAVAVPA